MGHNVPPDLLFFPSEGVFISTKGRHMTITAVEKADNRPTLLRREKIERVLAYGLLVAAAICRLASHLHRRRRGKTGGFHRSHRIRRDPRLTLHPDDYEFTEDSPAFHRNIALRCDGPSAMKENIVIPIKIERMKVWFRRTLEAAAWLIEQGLPEACDCSLAIAPMSHAGPAETPMRKPVIAWLLETPDTVRVRPARSAQATARVAWAPSP